MFVGRRQLSHLPIAAALYRSTKGPRVPLLWFAVLRRREKSCTSCFTSAEFHIAPGYEAELGPRCALVVGIRCVLPRYWACATARCVHYTWEINSVTRNLDIAMTSACDATKGYIKFYI